MRLFALASLALTLLCCLSARANETYSLDSYDGTEWKVFPADGLTWTKVAGASFEPADWVPGIVPGTVFVAYVNAGREENPDWGDNIYRVDESKYNRSFWYRTEFDRPQSSVGRRTILTLEGINRYAWVCFNGKKLGQIKGHVQMTRFDVTDLMKDHNVVAIRVDMPDAKHLPREESFVNYVSPTYMASHSWDWMPYVPGLNCGITNNIFLEFAGDVTIRDPWVRTSLSGGYTHADVAVQTQVANLTADSASVLLRATLQPGGQQVTKAVTVAPNATATVDFDAVSISDPLLWWPNGSGPQNLYTCAVEVVGEGGAVTDARTVTFGIKEYRYKTENTALTLYVNGKKTYCKGGNWGMSDYLLRCHGAEYDRRIRLHADMHYNMIRLWTGCVTDEEFYEACDRYGIMVWDDFWLTGPYTGLTGPDDRKEFLANAKDKVLRLRNHPSLCIWCGCNEGTPYDELNRSLADLIATCDGGDRLYQPNSHYGNGLSGSGWWTNFPPEEYFATGIWGGGGDQGDKVDWGFRSELGMAAFTTFESFREFMPEEYWWNNRQGTQNEMWEKHFFSDQAAYGGGAVSSKYFSSVQTGYGPSHSVEEFCEKAQLLNIEVMKALYEGWQSNLWNTASGLLFWMSQPAYPCFIWQTYDYYYDATGTYWGARKACEPIHIQWNCSNNHVEVVNTSATDAAGLQASVEVFRMDGTPYASFTTTISDITLPAASVHTIHVLKASAAAETLSGLYFIRLRLTDADGALLSENFYWETTKGKHDDYTALNTLPKADVRADILDDITTADGYRRLTVRVENHSNTVAFALRLRLVDETTKARILPVIMDENYFTLLGGESRTLTLEFEAPLCTGSPLLFIKQYGYAETDKNGVVSCTQPPVVESKVGDVRVSCVGNELQIGISADEIDHFCILSLDGNAQISGAHASTIDVSTLPKGIWLLQLERNDMAAVYRFLHI